MQLKIFPFCTPKVHFLGFSFKFSFLKFENVSGGLEYDLVFSCSW
jgi:hypothetical protein